jgi:anti-sigma B factor antagonist
MIQVTYLEDDVWSVAPDGRIDTAAARSFEDAFNGLLDEGHSRIVVDCSGIAYMASAGLRVLMIGLRRARGLGGDVCLAAVGPTVMQSFKMSGLDKLFAVHETVPAAVQSIRKPDAV